MMLIVAGLTRSGTTATMQMLYKGGHPCFGTWPAFEDYTFGQIPWDTIKDEAVKFVDPQFCQLPEGDYKIIQLHRDFKQMAKSQIKLLKATMPDYQFNVTLQQLIRGNKIYYSQLSNWTKKHETLHVHFENILKDPMKEARRIANFTGRDLDVEKMAECIVKRSASCYPGLLETSFMTEINND